MQRKHLVPLGLAFGLALGGVVVAATWMDGDRPGPQAGPGTVAREAAQNVPADRALQADLQRLRQGIDEIKRLATDSARDIGSLRSRMAALEQQQAEARQEMSELARGNLDVAGSGGKEAADARAKDKAPPVPSEEDQAAVEAEMQAYLQALDKKARLEKLDGAWANAAEKKIKDTVFANKVPGLNLVGAKCRSSMCRIELVRDASMPAEQGMRALRLLSPWNAPSSAYVADSGEVVVYLAREGHELPQ